MRKISTVYLREGMKLAKAIYSSRGGLIMPSGVQMQEPQILRLRDAGISEVYIDDPRVADIDIVEPVADVTRIKAIRTLREAYTAVRSQGTKAKIDTTSLLKVAKDIHDEVVYNNPRVANLIEIKSPDDYLFVHAINVAILGIIMARIGGYPNLSVDVAVGSLLKDLGMATINQEVLDKTEQLTPEELASIKHHPEITSELFKGKSEISAFTKALIAQHHERFDGSGYPLGLKDGQIHQIAKIVAIADTYAAMISDRPHRKKYRPYEAIEYIMSSSGFEFDHNMVDVFTKCTVPYPIGTMVKLSGGEKGVVIDLGRGLTSRPIIRLFTDQNGQDLAYGYEVNLSEPQHQTQLIVETLDE